MVIIVMGVCGCGKSTVGKYLADRLRVPFYDADDFHPPENVAKMRQGTPLNDADRTPWLKRLTREMTDWNLRGGAVLACSALKECYRQILRQGGQTQFVYLKGTAELIRQRMQQRRDHYMPVGLLESQFAILEEPHDAIIIDIAGSPADIAENILSQLDHPKTQGAIIHEKS